MKVDVPGMSAEEIDLFILGNVLQISGERKLEGDRKDENYHVIERGQGKFSRRVPLPAPVEVDDITASCKNGVLTVALPKKLEAKSGRMTIRLQ